MSKFVLPGKFGQRPDLRKTVILDQPADLYKILQDPSCTVYNLDFIGKAKCIVTYTDTPEFLVPSGMTNVVIACFTTAHARLALYEAIEKLGSERLLYTDTGELFVMILY